jgi:predicted ATP-dependent serine protease
MQKYKISKTSGGYTLHNLGNGSNESIGINHPKYDWVGKNQGRVITISDKGRWNSSQDYTGVYSSKATQPSQPVATVPSPQFQKLADLKIDDSLFQPMETGTIWDKFVSADGGLLPATNLMAAGAPGVGKTTVLLEMLARLQANGKKVLFISAEMSEMEMARYLRRFPSWAQLPILFLNNYESNADKVVESALMEGWDAVLTDSYTEVNDTVKDHTGWSRGKCEKWFLDLMTQHNKGLANRFTSFITILQLSKGGQFVGSNKLKHMTSAMLTLDWMGGENSGQRYMEFSKNRLGEVGKKLFFSLRDGVQFEEARYQRDLFNDALLAKEAEELDKEGSAFDRIFGLGVEDDEVTSTASPVEE